MSYPAGVLPLIIAHRGARRAAPENTLEAFDLALRQEADGIEFDVQCASDGTPVIWHDVTLARAGHPRKRVSDFSVRELATMGWGGKPGTCRTAIPKLQSVLRRYGGRTYLMIELKSSVPERLRDRWLAHVADLLHRFDPSQCHVLSFDPELLHRLKRRCGHVTTMLNMESWDRSGLEAMKAKNAPSAICMDVRHLSDSGVKALRDRQLPFAVYACEQRERAQYAVKQGAFALIGDRPDVLRRWIKGAGR